ncbi:Transcriptional activator protein acu-15 [Colletotrichum fructicola]|nr:Transcriptional activator protein acu-15 [Colletotrichum fructicola]
MDPSWDAQFPPTVSKACSRCHARKVKCDLRVPQCSACEKHNEQCNITERVTYSYAAVKSLQDKIRDLQATINSLTQDAETQPAEAPDVSRFGDVRKEAEEIGVLAIGRPNSYADRIYMGSATGSTFARIFFKQINLAPPTPNTQLSSASLDQDLFRNNAALPPQPIARFLFAAYIRRVHLWWPFISLPFLRSTIGHLYEDPARCSLYQRFLVLMVLALASSHSAGSPEYRRMLDVNSPADYFQTGLRFFLNFHDHSRDLQGLHSILLLSLWMMNSNVRSHGDDLWHLSRYAMSVAIEMGLHRRSSSAGSFSAEDTEIRNRTWWCIYSLERQVAVITGRVLSVREHAIDAPKPMLSSLDNLSSSEAQAAPVAHRLNVQLFNHLVRLRRIGGRVLESVYIARGPDGRASKATFQQICDEIEKIQQELQSWKRDIEGLDVKGTREYSEMKVEYGLLLLLMYRPSPTFMIPSREMVEICSRAVSGTVRQWLKLETQHGIGAVCRCFRHVHGVLMVGLAGLYCDWHTKTMARDADAHVLHAHGNDVAACIDLIERGIAWMKEDYLLKYRDLLQAARLKVYGPLAWEPTSPQTRFTDLRPPAGTADTLGIFEPDDMQSQLFFQGEGLETYVNQVTGYFDSSQVNLDDGLTAWYGSFLDEFQPTQTAQQE